MSLTPTYPLSMPGAPGMVEFVFQPLSAVSRQQSEFTYNSKYYAWDGQLRTYSVKVAPMTFAQAKLWRAFFLQLNGTEGTFLGRDEVGAATRGGFKDAVGGPFSPKVNGANQFGTDLTTDGWPHSIVPLFLAGDFIAINQRLYELTANCNSDGSGNATLRIWPYARYDIADNADILVGNAAYGRYRLTDAVQMPWDEDWYMQGVTFGCVEDL